LTGLSSLFPVPCSLFPLPSLRTEILRGDRHTACLFTAVTPIDENRCELHQSLYWTMPWMGVFRPILRLLTRLFLAQDRDVVIKQQEGLAYNSGMMLISAFLNLGSSRIRSNSDKAFS
jgi:hypothetical protein